MISKVVPLNVSERKRRKKTQFDACACTLFFPLVSRQRGQLCKIILTTYAYTNEFYAHTAFKRRRCYCRIKHKQYLDISFQRLTRTTFCLIKLFSSQIKNTQVRAVEVYDKALYHPWQYTNSMTGLLSYHNKKLQSPASPC